MVLNAWSILSVEFLDDKVKQLIASGAYGTCSWCSQAFENIWYANLTWFQIISTTDWATIGRPLVEHSFWTYFFFVANVFVVMWGLLNLIVAAIVDANIAAREDDVAIAAKMAAHFQQSSWNSFSSICQEMDQDKSGDISIREFKEFWKTNDELQHHLTIMGVQEKDMDRLLEIMDEDGNGTLEHDEFVEQFTQMRTLKEKTTLYFLLKFVQNIEKGLEQQNETIERVCRDVAHVRCSVATSALEMTAAPSERMGALPAPTETLRKTAFRNSAAESISDSGSATEVPLKGILRNSSGAPTEAHVKGCLRGSSMCSMSSTGSRGSAAVPDTTSLMKELPPGWYYFGTSLPPEAVSWCKDISGTDDVMPSSFHPQALHKVVEISEDIPKHADNEGFFNPGGSGWEPAPPPSCMPLPVSGLKSLDFSKDHLAQSEPSNSSLSHLGASASSSEGKQERPDELHEDVAAQPRKATSLCDDDDDGAVGSPREAFGKRSTLNVPTESVPQKRVSFIAEESHDDTAQKPRHFVDLCEDDDDAQEPQSDAFCGKLSLKIPEVTTTKKGVSFS